MPASDLQIDFQKVISKYNAQLGEASGRIVVLEAELETLHEHIEGLEAKLASLELSANAKADAKSDTK